MIDLDDVELDGTGGAGRAESLDGAGVQGSRVAVGVRFVPHVKLEGTGVQGSRVAVGVGLVAHGKLEGAGVERSGAKHFDGC